VALAFTAAAALALGACGSGRTDNKTPDQTGGETSAAKLIVGTTDKITTIDPAGSYDNGSYMVEYQVYQFVVGFTPGNPVPAPDIAEKCDFTEDGSVYECTLKKDLKFANGHDLTASDVKFTFDRQKAINDPNGPASLLEGLSSTEVVDDTTVRFHLAQANNVIFEQILASPAGPIVDEETFPSDELLPDDDIVKAQAFSGPYKIDTYKVNEMIEYSPNPDYSGVYTDVKNGGVTVQYFAESNNLKLAIENGEIDIAWRSLSPTDIDALSSNDNVDVIKGPGGEIRYIVFNMNTMPGDTPEQKFAIRQAIASTVDRAALSEQIFKGTYTPLCSYVPDGVPGANEAVCDTYGTAPDVAKATAYLADAGVATPVTLKLQYAPEHYGPSSADEYGLIKSQLEASGLFTVDLQSTEWSTYAEERTADAYPLYQLGWFPDYPDADNYLSPFFGPNNFLGNHFEADDVTALIEKEVAQTDEAERIKDLEALQTLMAEKYLSTVPLLQGAQVAVAAKGVQGVADTLDAAFQFRLAALSKS
jgi:peptide/nickel transport system substrate-binding protein